MSGLHTEMIVHVKYSCEKQEANSMLKHPATLQLTQYTWS